jgi:hypothetical protein
MTTTITQWAVQIGTWPPTPYQSKGTAVYYLNNPFPQDAGYEHKLVSREVTYGEWTASKLRTSFENPIIAELRNRYAEWYADSDGECTLGGAAAEVLGWGANLPENDGHGWDFSAPENSFGVKVLERLKRMYY